jgi:mRNA interferase RelE/StbE
MTVSDAFPAIGGESRFSILSTDVMQEFVRFLTHSIGMVHERDRMGGVQVKITYEKQPEAYFAKQNVKQVVRIKRAIAALPAGDIKKLRGIENAFRLRVGGVRVLFKNDDENITVIKIDNRGDVYK